MRLSLTEIEAILNSVAEQDSEAKVYLFGSRVDDAKKGGDIDLLVVSQHSLNVNLLLAKIKMRIGDQKIDVRVACSEELESDMFLQHIMKTAKQLSSE